MIPGAAPTGGQDAVIMRVTGGLGNQLFQYAMGRALALRHDVPLLLDLSHYTTPGPHTARSFELDKLNTCYAVATEEDLRPFRASWMRKLLERLDLKPSPRLIHQPASGSAHPCWPPPRPCTWMAPGNPRSTSLTQPRGCAKS